MQLKTNSRFSLYKEVFIRILNNKEFVYLRYGTFIEQKMEKGLDLEGVTLLKRGIIFTKKKFTPSKVLLDVLSSNFLILKSILLGTEELSL